MPEQKQKDLLLLCRDGILELLEVEEDQDSIRNGEIAYPKTTKAYPMRDGRRLYMIEELPDARVEAEEVAKLKDKAMLSSLLEGPAAEKSGGITSGSQLPLLIISILLVIALILT